jgi:hypothetical protein
VPPVDDQEQGRRTGKGLRRPQERSRDAANLGDQPIERALLRVRQGCRRGV